MVELPKLREWEEKRGVGRGQTDRAGWKEGKREGEQGHGEGVGGGGDKGANTLTTKRL